MTVRTPGMSRVQCAHCGDTFLVSKLQLQVLIHGMPVF